MICRRPGPEILVAVPTRGQIQWATVTRLQQIRDAEKGLPPILYEADHLSVAATRNLIIRKFLDGPCKVLVMVDDDVVPDEKMLRLTDYVPQYAMAGAPSIRFGMVGAPYPTLGSMGLIHTVYEETTPGSFQDSLLGLTTATVGSGVEECAAIGTGCVAIARETLETLEEPWFEITQDDDGRVISDDILFCHRLAKEGLAIGVDWDQAADHHTTVSLAAIYIGGPVYA